MKQVSKRIQNSGEYGFACVLSAAGKEFIYKPARFSLGDAQYSPDFYVPEEKCFYEVVGTRQAYAQNCHKFPVLRKLYPFIELKIVAPDGTLYKSNAKGSEQVGPQLLRWVPGNAYRHLDEYGEPREDNLQRLKEMGLNREELAAKANVVVSTVQKWLCGYHLARGTDKKLSVAMREARIEQEQRQGVSI